MENQSNIKIHQSKFKDMKYTVHTHSTYSIQTVRTVNAYNKDGDVILNIDRQSTSLREKHDAESGSNGSGR